MCPNCQALEANPQYPHPHLKWTLPEFDPTATEAVGSHVFEKCTVCGTRWFDERRVHRPPRLRGQN